MSHGSAKTFALTALAICAFAGNSLLTRMALAPAHIGAAQFVGIRLMAGAVTLALLGARRGPHLLPRAADTPGVVSLLVYAVAFTFAYTRLGAAVGALILFPTVQLTLVLMATLRGAAPSSRQRMGLMVAVAGLVVLLAPGSIASRSPTPPVAGAVLMALAGIAWGVYTMLGRGAVDPYVRTARNFIGAAPLALIPMLIIASSAPRLDGVLLAIASGAITSALGYVVWYAVLPRLNVATAGAAQLFVPVITAAGAVLWLHETPSVTLVGACALIIGGIWLTNSSPRRPAAPIV